MKKKDNCVDRGDNAKQILMTYNHSGCPINRKAKVSMLEDTFKRMCLKFQDIASKGTSSKWNNSEKAMDAAVCLECKIGERVKNDKPFTPSVGITLIAPDKPKLKIKLRFRKNSKR